MVKINDFERQVDFSFWQDICERHGTLRRYRRGEYFVYEGKIASYLDISLRQLHRFRESGDI